MIHTAQIRLIADDEQQARAAIIELVNTIGTARIIFTSPQPGRDKAGDGRPQWLAYGTFQFETDEPAQEAPKPDTGATAALGTQPLRRRGGKR